MRRARERALATTGTPVEPSKAALLKQQGAEADLAVKQLRLAQLRKALITVDGACKVVEAVFAEVRTDGLALMADIASEKGLDVDELKRRFLEVMAGPLEARREPFQELADDLAKKQLPT